MARALPEKPADIQSEGKRQEVHTGLREDVFIADRVRYNQKGYDLYTFFP